MLRNGSGGARQTDVALAVSDADDAAEGADGGAVEGTPAELTTTNPTPTPTNQPPTPTVPVGPDLSSAVGCAVSRPAVGSAVPASPELLSLCRLSGAGLAGLGRDELLGVLGDIERVANRLAGYRAEVLGALDALSRSGAAPDASPHLSLRDAAGVSERDARKMVRAAGKAREHPGVLDALSEGDVNAAQAEALCDARVPDGVRADLVAAAAGEDTDATRRRVRRAEADHCVETPMERFERQRRARSAGWQRDHEGMLRLWAKLDPEVGAAVEAGLEALRRQYWLDDKQVRNGRRTPAQRDADVLAYALAGITLTDADTAAVDRLHARQDRQQADETPEDTARRGLSPSRRTTPPKREAKRAAARCEQPGCAAPRGHETYGEDQATNGEDLWVGRRLPPAQISVLIGLDALRGRTDEMGLTDAGVELPPHVVRRLACDAEIIPMILGGPGGPADAGRSSRTVPLRLRRLLIARDRHCQWPGCDQPPSRCDAHHIHHWADGGPTDLDNLVLLCHRHHHHLHQHGYTMVAQPDGTWLAVQESDARPTTTPRRAKRQARAP